MMYADVVMEKAGGLEPKGGKGIRKVWTKNWKMLSKSRVQI
jgi:hypothetical protein